MTDFLSIQPAAAQSHAKDGTGSSYKISPVTLKGDEFFVLADSHTNSIDSRIFSAVKFDEIVGRVKGIEDGGK